MSSVAESKCRPFRQSFHKGTANFRFVRWQVSVRQPGVAMVAAVSVISIMARLFSSIATPSRSNRRANEGGGGIMESRARPSRQPCRNELRRVARPKFCDHPHRLPMTGPASPHRGRPSAAAVSGVAALSR